MPPEATPIKHIITSYVGQLLYGCNNPSCTESLCDTGRRNTSNDRPVRKYTQRSARIIAIALASGPKPDCRLCSHYQQNIPEPSASNDEVSHDPSSLIQHLGDTSPVRTLCDLEKDLLQPNADVCKDGVRPALLYQSLNPLICQGTTGDPLVVTNSKTTNILSNETACRLLSACLDWLLDEITLGEDVICKESDCSKNGILSANRLISRGLVYATSSKHLPGLPEVKVGVAFLDLLDKSSPFQLLCRVALAIAQRTQLEDKIDHLKHQGGREGRGGKNALLPLLMMKLSSRSAVSRCSLVIFLKKVFLVNWDGEPTVKRGTIASGALEMLTTLSRLVRVVARNSDIKECKTREFFAIEAVYTRLDPTAIAESWKNLDDWRAHRLLSYWYLFSTEERATIFKAKNYLIMRDANAASEKHLALHRRTAHDNGLNDALDEHLKVAEEHYLLLNVSRSNTLKDACDQLWQRRKCELLLPLRVRLGEIEDFEIGHDLGGVQIEFFNLICKEVFSEAAQLFTTDAQTGISYFRPGSLQPLHMFETFGLLMALALYNGVLLPASFPLVFYKLLCSSLSYTSILDDIADGWTTERRTLQFFLDQDIEHEYSFPMDANGVRLSVTGTSKTAGRRSLEVSSISPETRNAPDLSGDNPPSWPGWHFVLSEKPVDTVNASNKEQYIKEYVHWLTVGSVAPQLEALIHGFESLVDRPWISILKPADIQACVEGSAQIDIQKLRGATTYEGYGENSKYIQTFWSVVSLWPEEKHRQLLKFVTAAERIPIGGMGTMTFKIQRTTPGDPNDLPTSSTCFGTLMLPRYQTAEMLNEKLSLAIAYGCEGFGMG